MPTLFRFLALLAVLGGLAFAGIAALSMFGEPDTREMTIPIAPERLQPRRP